MKFDKMQQQRFQVLYFLSYLVFSCVMTQFTPFLSSLGYDTMERGALLSSYAVTTILFQLMFGILSDRFQTIKKIILPSFAACALSACIFFTGSTQIPGLHLVLVSLCGGFVNTCCGLYDTWILESGEHLKRRLSFIKAFGSVGWAVGSTAISYIIVRFSYQGMVAAVFVISLLVFVQAGTIRDIEHKERKQKASLNDIRLLLKDRDYCFVVVILFLLYCGVITNNSAVIDKMLELGATAGQIGMKWSVQSMIELPTYLLGGYILVRFNHYQLLKVSALAMAVQFFLFYLSDNINVIIFLSVFQMFTTPLILVASKMILHALSPSGLKVSGQLFALSMFTGVSSLVVPAAAGVISNYMGVNITLISIVILEVLAFFLIAWMDSGRKADAIQEC